MSHGSLQALLYMYILTCLCTIKQGLQARVFCIVQGTMQETQWKHTEMCSVCYISFIIYNYNINYNYNSLVT